MNYWIRTNEAGPAWGAAGTIVGPMDETTFRDRLEKGLVAATDEISNDGFHWTRLGQTPFFGQNVSARFDHPGVRPANLHVPGRLGSVVGNFTETKEPVVQPPVSAPPAGGRVPPVVSSPRRRPWWFHAVAAVAFALLCAAVAWHLLRPVSHGRGHRGNGPVFVESEAGEGDSGEDASSGDRAVLLETLPVNPVAAQVAAYRFFFPGEKDMSGLFDQIRANGYVRSKWDELAEKTVFHYLPGNNEINAYSSFYDPVGSKERPTVVLQGGLVRFARVVGISMARENRGEGSESQKRTFEMLEALVNVRSSSRGKFGVFQVNDALARIGIENGVFLDEERFAKAVSIADGMCLAVLSHEMGHLALNHPAAQRPNLAVSRNEERQADLFADSVISTFPSGDRLLLGQILFHLAGALMGEDPDEESERTHPFSSERVYETIRANRELAASWGLTEEAARTWLNEAAVLLGKTVASWDEPLLLEDSDFSKMPGTAAGPIPEEPEICTMVPGDLFSATSEFFSRTPSSGTMDRAARRRKREKSAETACRISEIVENMVSSNGSAPVPGAMPLPEPFSGRLDKWSVFRGTVAEGDRLELKVESNGFSPLVVALASRISPPSVAGSAVRLAVIDPSGRTRRSFAGVGKVPTDCVEAVVVRNPTPGCYRIVVLGQISADAPPGASVSVPVVLSVDGASVRRPE